MSLPKPERLTLVDLLLEYEGIRLFVERAAAVKSDFVLTEQNAAAVLQICQQLEGIPLALELAAARTRLLSPEHLAEHLKNRFELLTQGSRTALPRHQTLRATIDWSYDLLPEPERILFQRLYVFAGGFTLEAAEAICSEKPLAPGALLDSLTRLVDRSLVKVERESGHVRYRVMETIREYARQKLDETGDTEHLRQRHAGFFIAFAEQADSNLRKPEQFEWLDRLELDHDNLRAGWDYAIATNVELAYRLASALLDFWSMRGNPGEGRQWLALLLPRTNRWGQSARRAHALSVAGRLAYLQRDFEAARRLLEEGLVGARAANHQNEIAFALLWLGWTLHRRHDELAAKACLEECLEISRALQDEWAIAMIFYQLAALAGAQGRYEEAEQRYMESLAIFRDQGDNFRAGYVLNGLGELARLLGDYERAGRYYEQHMEILQARRSHGALATSLVNLGWVYLHAGDERKSRATFEESSKLSLAYGNKNGIALSLAGLAGLLGTTGQPVEAAELFGAVEVLLERIGMAGRMDAADQQEFEHYVETVRAQLDQDAFAQAWKRGRSLSLEQALDLALGASSDWSKLRA
ncbi:MAG: ATP-binding protein [Bacteroidota bacterium]